MSRLTILSVAYPFTEVGADAVGGSEQILTALDQALTAADHHSIVIAADGSQIQGTLISSPRVEGRLDDSLRDWGAQVHRQLISRALELYPVDIVHMHSLDFHRYMPPETIPVLATLHLPLHWYPPGIFDRECKNFYINCVSRSQNAHCAASTRLLNPITNGVDVAGLGMEVPKKDFVLALGRICPEKGFHLALEAAHQADVSLILGGQIFPYAAHFEYFNTEISPRLDHARKFIGPVRLPQKRRLLSEARCLVIPSLVAETSSLVAMEAMACGTPVVAFDAGALPEIIDHGKTGYIVSSAEQMSEALKKVDELDPEVCRQTARMRFSVSKMTARYLALYETLTCAPRLAGDSAIHAQSLITNARG
jgi:glycosyltransferase involved in cell wall biosynthesis